MNHEASKTLYFSEQEGEDARIIEYWRSASLREHGRTLEELLIFADLVNRAKVSDASLINPNSEPKQFRSAA
jgi:hypothetical protein